MTVVKGHKEVPPYVNKSVDPGVINDIINRLPEDSVYRLGSNNSRMISDTLNIQMPVLFLLPNPTNGNGTDWHYANCNNYIVEVKDDFHLVHYPGQMISVINGNDTSIELHIGSPGPKLSFHLRKSVVIPPGHTHRV